MSYTPKQQEDLAHDCILAHSELRDLMLECLRQADATDVAASKEHLRYGAARRLGVMARAMQQIFSLFPPDTERPLPMESLHDVQINLHAFVINVFGVFENFAWAFVHRHNLLPTIGRPVNVSMFKEATRRHLPVAVEDYLSSDAIARWHSEYLKNYRDALAHRIPLYIPPKAMTKEEGELFSALEAEKWGLAGRADWDRINVISAEQDAIGSPCFTFLHSFEDGGASRVVLLHPQIISDSKTVIDFGHRFLASWHQRR
ncbi:hypothetical protein ACFPTO_02170 [Paraburkholderia denitrificans]|uniref:Uncharacterized protein n=1 Tax=Paraburkholderia denitrificans TaxID=694025 RepID=A0ABW0J3L9_9BURK